MSLDWSNMLWSCRLAPTRRAHDRGMVHRVERGKPQDVAFVLVQGDRGVGVVMLIMTTPLG